jgi:rhodanese-related sulfurtransferase
MKIINKILIIAISLLIASCGIDDSKKYVLSPEETLNAYLNKQDIYPAEKIANILLCKKAEKYQLIDIRTPHEFAIKNIEGSINVPAKHIFDPEYSEIINQDKKINVIYGSNPFQTVDTYIMLKQLNYKNIKVVLGGFTFINNYIIDSYGIKTGIYNDEKPRFDFIRLVAGAEKPIKDSISRPKITNVNTNRIVKKFDEDCPDLN